MSETSESKHGESVRFLRGMADALERATYEDSDERRRALADAASLRVAIAALSGDAQKRTREIDRVICDHGHVSDQVRDLQRAVLRVCETLDILTDVARLNRPRDLLDPIRRLVAHEVGRHSGDPITWVPKRESPFRAEDE